MIVSSPRSSIQPNRTYLLNIEVHVPDIVTAVCLHHLGQRILAVQRSNTQAVCIDYTWYSGVRSSGVSEKWNVALTEGLLVLQQLKNTL